MRVPTLPVRPGCSRRGVPLETRGGIPGATMAMLHDSGSFPSLDATLTAALSGILSGDMLRTTKNTKGHIALEGKLMKGRQVFSKSSRSTTSPRPMAASSVASCK